MIIIIIIITHYYHQYYDHHYGKKLSNHHPEIWPIQEKMESIFFQFFFGPNHRFFGYSHYYSVKKRNKTKKNFYDLKLCDCRISISIFVFFFSKKKQKNKMRKKPQQKLKIWVIIIIIFLWKFWFKMDKQQIHENVEKRTAWSSSACKDKRKNLQKKNQNFCRLIIIHMMINAVTLFMTFESWWWW